MSTNSYFYDQHSRVSHLGGIHRSKRNLKDLNQALCQAKLAEETSQTDKTSSLLIEENEPINVENAIGKMQIPFLSEIIIKELDSTIQKSNPNTSLPSSLILQLHSTWNDLIKNTEYKQKIWRTKVGEDSWRHYLQRKHFDQLKAEKRQSIHENKLKTRRKSSRISITSTIHRQSFINPSRPSSVGSMLSTTGIDNHRKAMMDHSTESMRHGVHVEFKFSTQILKSVQKTPIIEPKFVLFDVQKPGVDFNQEMIHSIQNKCKRLLSETKQKILSTTINDKQSKKCQVWFYNDNPFMRNKNNLLLLNESSRRQRAKFVLSLLRHEIPEKYNINIEIPEMKSKCYVELPDGSCQIYYPSGRLAVLRLRSSISTTLFFDDSSIPTKQLLGLVTSSGNVLVMQPTFHARFITNNHNEYAYLCNGKTGLIENQLQWSLKPNNHKYDEDEQYIPLIENTVQFQLNSFMQLEYHNPLHIRFAFQCRNEEFKYELGSSSLRSVQSPLLMDITKKRLSKKRISSINVNDFNHQKSTDEQIDLYQLPIMKELIQMRKNIKTVCENWLKEYRTIFGIMDIDAYCLTDLPQAPVAEDIKPIESRRASLTTESSNKSQLLRRSATRFDKNVITQSIEQFVPHSDIGRAMKQRIYSGKKLFPTTLPIIK